MQSVEPDPPGIARIQQKLSELRNLRSLAEKEDLEGLSTLLSDFSLQKPGGRTTDPEKSARVETFKGLIDSLKELLRNLAELIVILENRELLRGLFRLTGAFQEMLFSRKQASGVISFIDVLTMAVSGLRDDKGLRRYYKGLFSYIMIDEFQDNNLLQEGVAVPSERAKGF